MIRVKMYINNKMPIGYHFLKIKKNTLKEDKFIEVKKYSTKKRAAEHFYKLIYLPGRI